MRSTPCLGSAPRVFGMRSRLPLSVLVLLLGLLTLLSATFSHAASATPTFSLTLSSPDVSATGTVTLPFSQASATVITLTTSVPNAVSLPASVLIPVGQTSAQFSLNSASGASPSGTSLTITAAYSGGSASAPFVAIYPGGAQVGVSPNSLSIVQSQAGSVSVTTGLPPPSGPPYSPPNYPNPTITVYYLPSGVTASTGISYSQTVIYPYDPIPPYTSSNRDPNFNQFGPTTLTTALNFTANGSAALGTGTVVVVSNSGGLSGAASLTLTVTAPPTPTTIIVSPTPASLFTGGMQTFTAVVKDQNGNVISPTPALTWSVDAGGVGSITTSQNNGQYLAGQRAGLATVRAAVGTVSGTAAVTVTQAVPNAPTGLTAAVRGGKIVLSWTSPGGPITSYLILRGTTSGGESNTPLATVTGTPPATTIPTPAP